MKLKIAGICIALLLLLAGSTSAQWQFQYQVELGYNFSAVHFPTATVGYIVGSGGAIFKTVDAGATWAQQTSPTASSLNDVFFTDATHGYAVGATGTIIYTTDGTNWSLHAQSGVITTHVLNAVWFVGTSGWIGGGVDGSYADILLSTDGGTTWAQNAGTDPSLDLCTDITFWDANNGCASLDNKAVPLIMYTTDGGVNWTGSTVNLGPYSYLRNDIECIYAINATTYVAAGWGSNAGSSQPTIVLVSTDGGATFNCPDVTYAWQTFTYAFGITKFADGEAVIVGGGTQSAGMSLHATGPSYTTWTRYPAFYGEAINDACVMPGTNRIVAVGDAGLIAVSLDRGATWHLSYDAGMPFQGVQAFAHAGQNRVYGAGAGGAFLWFDPLLGTHSYHMASPNNWGPNFVGDLDLVKNTKFSSEATWDSTYNDVMYLSAPNKYFIKSYDLGTTWKEFSHSNSLADAYMSMYWFSPDTGFVVGHKAIGTNRDEVIWKTVDGGVTLTEVVGPSLPGTNMQWNSIDFAPDNRQIGVVVGDDNYIRYTADGGATWPLATENIVAGIIDLEEVVMINATTAIAVGDSGTLVKTTDGGANWSVQPVPWAKRFLLDVEASSANRLYVSGADRLFYYSTDGGTTWTDASVTPLATTDDVMGIHFQGTTGLLWVGCHYSKVLNRSDGVAGTNTPKLPFALNQNYPNPFNPSTTIEFAIAKDDHVGLNVYDVSGRLVATIMNKNLKAGKYTVSFNADKLATGVYFYKLTTSTGEETRKMILIR